MPKNILFLSIPLAAVTLQSASNQIALNKIMKYYDRLIMSVFQE